MGLISIAAFRAKPGKEQDLTQVLDDRLPMLRALKLATDRPEVRCRSRDGVVVTISEWASREAIERAHQTPEVHALWERFFACCEWVKLESLGESGEDFATFEAID